MLAQHPFPVLSAPISPPHLSPAFPSPRGGSVVLRQATPLDLDTMVSIALAAMPLDPQWDYRFPHRRSFPDDTWHFTRRRYRQFLDNKNGRWSVVLADLVHPPSGVHDQDFQPQTIAFAVWNIGHVLSPQDANASNQDTTSAPPSPTLSRRDASPKRLEAWSRTLGASSQELFDDKFGSSHFRLQILATDPRFQRIGAGSALCREGINSAERLGMRICLFASPMGQRLYSRLGFEHLATVTVKADDEDDFVSVEAMVYQSKSAK